MMETIEINVASNRPGAKRALDQRIGVYRETNIIRFLTL